MWNKGITTYPGLYWVAYVAYRLANFVQRVSCSPQFLRAVNLIVSCLLPALLYHCRQLVGGSVYDCAPRQLTVSIHHSLCQITPGSRDASAIAILLYLYPLNIFYYNLFYTDTLSTTTLVLTYWLCLRQSSATSSPAAVDVGSQIVLLLVSQEAIMRLVYIVLG